MRMTIAGAALVLMTGCAASGQTTTAGPSGGEPAAARSPGGPATAGGPSPSPTGTAGGSPSPSPAVTRETCNGTPLHTSANGFLEVRGTSADAELWGLLFAEVPFKRGKEIKIVWRMTGEGPLEVSASLPSGKQAKLVWLEDHGGSNWQRPGHEWGTGWVFPEPGCWKVKLSRTRGSGHAWLRVK
ncbi:hypothetical protein [Nonomuraea sp. LPB2021202275-12-8]|uniref:hypothetical protein n=1 Tax=Nonomuraea sp. LPB2021202275-12-8 TaxID=3120159 RepID=UPI00300C791F